MIGEYKMKKNLLVLALALVIGAFGISSCTSVSGGRSYSASGSQEKEITVGKVQKELRKGMSGAEVAELLGSPNIVTKDENGLETWVYDRIATEANYNENSSVLFLIVYGQANQNANMTVTQKTLTVVVKFNPNSKIESFSYHASKF